MHYRRRKTRATSRTLWPTFFTWHPSSTPQGSNWPRARPIDPVPGPWNDPCGLFQRGELQIPRERYSTTVLGLRILRDGLEHNAADFAHVEKHLRKLGEMTERAEALVAQRNALEAQQQKVTRELQTLLDEVRRLASFMRAAARVTYGNGSEKLVELGMRPSRHRSRARGTRETED